VFLIEAVVLTFVAHCTVKTDFPHEILGVVRQPSTIDRNSKLTTNEAISGAAERPSAEVADDVSEEGSSGESGAAGSARGALMPGNKALNIAKLTSLTTFNKETAQATHVDVRAQR